MQGILDIVSEYGWDFVSGTWLTIQLVVIAGVLGLLIAVPVALARLSENRVVHGLATAYSLFFRGTPLLVQIFLIYFGLGQFDFVRSSFLWPLLREAYVCALITFSLNTAAYSGEILRGDRLLLPRGIRLRRLQSVPQPFPILRPRQRSGGNGQDRHRCRQIPHAVSKQTPTLDDTERPPDSFPALVRPSLTNLSTRVANAARDIQIIQPHQSLTVSAFWPAATALPPDSGCTAAPASGRSRR